ncbi:MAG: hypothetical protein PHE68_06115, partial [Candidatus Peribacteraceae bacterium]|nr:hypothetical protein [Candidatus Peribacteraceae bacterium]
PHTMEEFFVAGTEPKEPDDIYRPLLIDTRNGLLANNCLPGEATAKPQWSRAETGDQVFVQQKAFAVFPMEVEKWARENGWPTPPTRQSPLCGSASSRADSSRSGPEMATSQSATWLEITRPQTNDSYKLDPLIPDTEEKIVFEAHASSEIRTIDWFVNGKKVGTGKAPDFRFPWQPKAGTFTVEARTASLTIKRSFEVVH